MPDLNNIPEAKTAEEIAALQASDPAAFDLDDVPEQTDDDKAAAELAEKEAADKAADEAAAKEAAEKAEADKGKDDRTIDKRQYDGVLGDLRDTRSHLATERQRADALAAELAALKAGPAINYDEEITSLKEKWDNDEFEGTLDEFIAARDALLAGKIKADTRNEFQQEQAQAAALKAEQAWAEAANAFAEAHPEYADPEAKTDLEAALHGVFAKFPNASDADKLERAHKIVQAMNGKVEAAPAAPSTDPNADRNKADAQASAKASAAPKVVAGGVSSAGGPVGNIDMANLKPGQFSKLSKDQQEAALGGAGAL